MDASEKFWDKIAARFAERPIPDLQAYHAKLDATRACLGPEDVILDVGCGTGSLALALSTCVSEVQAIDLSSEMIRIANQKAADENTRNVTFHVTTIANASFESETFDAICAYSILHLVDDRGAALNRILDLLKPGGLFISATPCLGDSRVPFRLLLPILTWLGKAPTVQVFGRQELDNDLQDAGFVEIIERKVSSGRTNAFLVAAKPGPGPSVQSLGSRMLSSSTPIV